MYRRAKRGTEVPSHLDVLVHGAHVVHLFVFKCLSTSFRHLPHVTKLPYCTTVSGTSQS